MKKVFFPFSTGVICLKSDKNLDFFLKVDSTGDIRRLSDLKIDNIPMVLKMGSTFRDRSVPNRPKPFMTLIDHIELFWTVSFHVRFRTERCRESL